MRHTDGKTYMRGKNTVVIVHVHVRYSLFASAHDGTHRLNMKWNLIIIDHFFRFRRENETVLIVLDEKQSDDRSQSSRDALANLDGRSQGKETKFVVRTARNQISIESQGNAPDLRSMCNNRVKAVLNGHVPQFDRHVSRTRMRDAIRIDLTV